MQSFSGQAPHSCGALLGSRRRPGNLHGITVGLRLYYGTQQFLTADGYYPGLSLLALNLRRAETWEQLLVTFGIIPLLAVAA